MAVIGATVFAYWEDQWRNQTPNDVTVSLTDLTTNSEHGTVAEDATVIGYDIQGATAVSQTWYVSDDNMGTNEVELTLPQPQGLSLPVDYWVSTSGSDANDGLTEGTAWRSLNNIDASLLVADSTVVVRIKGGTYDTINDSVRVQNSGVSNAKLIIVCESGVVVDGVNYGTSQNAFDPLGDQFEFRVYGNGLTVQNVTSTNGNAFSGSGDVDCYYHYATATNCRDAMTCHQTSRGYFYDITANDSLKSGVAHIDTTETYHYRCTVNEVSGGGIEHVVNCDGTSAYFEDSVIVPEADNNVEIDGATLLRCQIGTTTTRSRINARDAAATITDSYINGYLNGRENLTLTRCFGRLSIAMSSTGGDILVQDGVFIGPATGLSNTLFQAGTISDATRIRLIDNIFEGSWTLMSMDATRAGYLVDANSQFYNNAIGAKVYDADLVAADAGSTILGTLTSDPEIGSADTLLMEDYAFGATSPMSGAGSTGDVGFGSSEVANRVTSLGTTYEVSAGNYDLKYVSVEVSDGSTNYRSNYAQIRFAPPSVVTSAAISPSTGFEGTTFVLTAPTSSTATYSLDTFTFNEVDVSGELSGSNWDSTGKGAGELVATYTATNSGGTRTNNASSTVTQSVTNNLPITAPDTLAIEEEALVFEAPTTNLGSLQLAPGDRPEVDILWNWDFGETGAVYQNAHPNMPWANNPNHKQGPRVVHSFTTYANTGETEFTVTLTGRDRFGNVETGTTTITVRSAAAHTWNSTYVVSFANDFTGLPAELSGATQITSEAAFRTAVTNEAGNSKVRFLFRPGERFNFNNSSFLLINHAGMWGSWAPGTRARFSTNIGSPGSGAWSVRTLFRLGSLTNPLLIRDINLVGAYNPVTGTCTDALFTAFQSLASPPKLTFHNIRSRGLNNTWSLSGGSPGIIAFSDCDIQDWKNYGCYIEQGNTAGTSVVVAAYGGTWTQNPAVGPLNAGDGRTNLRNTDFPDHGPFRLGVGSAICFNDVWFGSFNTWVSNNIHQGVGRLYHRTEPYDHRWYVNRCYLGGSGIDFDRFNVSQSVNRGGIFLMDKVYWKGEYTKSGDKPFRGIGSVTLRNAILYDATTNGTVLCLELPDVNGEGSGVVAQSIYDLPVEVYNNTFISLRNGGTWNPISIDGVYTDVTTVNNTLHAPNVNNSGSFDAGTFIGDEASLFRPLAGSPKLDSGSSTLWAIDDFFGNLRSTPVTQSHFENIAGAVAPVISGVPTISGTTTQGQTLTATEASVTGSPTPTTTWQWERSGTPISGATASTYVLAALDVGETITVVQTETNSEGSDTAESAATATIAASGGGGS
ncbi:MAG: hypothetical protein AAF125_00750, partial [Chloroflexota bacterium]